MLENLKNYNAESIHHFYDKETGLKIIICLHNTFLGPGLGGVRIWDYKTEEEALKDVLRLSEGMTLKCAGANINMGGAKAVIIGDVNKIKNEASLKKFGEFVNKLGGNYITAPDVNTNIDDVAVIHKTTKYAIGLPKYLGGSDDPSEFTAYGTYMGIKAAIKKKYKTDSLKNKSILVEGVGKVGQFLINFLSKENAKIYISDISKTALENAKKLYDVSIIDPSESISLKVDVYSPCALGATLNTTNIPKLNCKIVAGSANNQLEDMHLHDKMLFERDIIYMPDFIINSGGLINVYNEYIGGYDRNKTFKEVEQIYDRCLNLFKTSDDLHLSLNTIAFVEANKRLENKTTKNVILED